MRTRLAWSIGAVLVLSASMARADGGWLTDPQTHCRVWDDEMQPGEEVHWKGACRNGIAEGQGVTEWLKDGKLTETIEGNLKAGHVDGRVLMNTAAGARIETEFHDGLIDGLDVVTNADGTRTTLHYKQGKLFGRVQVAWTDGGKLDGEFDDKQQLHGLRTWPNGNRYEGDFVNFVPNGQGKFVDGKSGGTYSGTFVDGYFDGQGEIIFDNGDIYQGAFQHGQANGYGTFRDGRSGEIYRGNWADNCLSQANSESRRWATIGKPATACGFN